MVIHPMMFNDTGTSSATASTDCSSSDREWYTFIGDPAEEEFPEIEVKHVWPVNVIHEPVEVVNSKFMRRFRGNNRGRHWNRRR